MKKTILYGILGLGFILTKLWYKEASAEALAFILVPITRVVEIVTGHLSTYVTNEGYLFNNLGIIISKSCSGFNFFLTCFLMLSVLLIINLHQIKKKISAGILFLTITYIITIIANCSRIITALRLKPFTSNLFPEDLIHSSIGVVTYFFFLIATYLLVEKIIIKKLIYADATQS